MRKLLSKSTILLILLLMITSTAFAKIEFEYKENGSVNYKSTKKIMRWSTVEWFEFVKNIEKNGTESYFIRFGIGGWGSRPNADAEVFIDGNKTSAKLVEIPYNKYTKPKTVTPRPEDTYTFYDVSTPTIEQLPNCKKELYFVFFPDKKDPLVFRIDEENLKEIKEIITLKYEDWQAVKSGKLEKE